MSRKPPKDPVPVNNAPTGKVTISGNPIIGQTLTVTNNITDADGIATAIAYQWCRTKKGTRTNITKATKNTYILIEKDLDHTISVIASYTDKLGNAESVESVVTAAVEKKKEEEKEKKQIVRHSRRKKPTQGERVRSGRRSVFFRQPTMWRINHPAGRSNTVE
jgi:hypothetical protein